jgi:hypothetical protein
MGRQQGVEATRIERPGTSPRSEATPEGCTLPLERLALVVLILGRGRAAVLLAGLRESEAARTRAFLVGFEALSSARRQARVAVEFGVRPEAAGRLRRVMDEAPETLRWEIFQRLPPYHRSLFPTLQTEPPRAGPSARVGAWAERLIQEATR